MEMITHDGVRYRPEDAARKGIARSDNKATQAKGKRGRARNKARAVEPEATSADSTGDDQGADPAA